MMIADIINNYVHNVFEFDGMPPNPPRIDGSIPLYVDVTDMDVHTGMIYNPEDGSFSEPLIPEEVPNDQLETQTEE